MSNPYPIERDRHYDRQQLECYNIVSCLEHKHFSILDQSGRGRAFYLHDLGQELRRVNIGHGKSHVDVDTETTAWS